MPKYWICSYLGFILLPILKTNVANNSAEASKAENRVTIQLVVTQSINIYLDIALGKIIFSKGMLTILKERDCSISPNPPE